MPGEDPEQRTADDYRQEVDDIRDTLGPLYPLLRSVKTFSKLMENYKRERNETKRDVIGETLSTTRELASYYDVDAEKIVKDVYENLLPQKYHRQADVVSRVILRMPWDEAVEFASDMIKAYGADSERGGYRRTSDVVEEKISEFLAERMFETFTKM